MSRYQTHSTVKVNWIDQSQAQLLVYPEARLPFDTKACQENNTGLYLKANSIFPFADYLSGGVPPATCVYRPRLCNSTEALHAQLSRHAARQQPEHSSTGSSVHHRIRSIARCRCRVHGQAPASRERCPVDTLPEPHSRFPTIWTLER